MSYAYSLFRCPTCVLCGKMSFRFRDYGDPLRRQVMCPKCGSLERHRLIWLYFQHRTSLLTLPAKRILHIAPEESLSNRLKQYSHLEYVTGDLAPGRAMYVVDLMAIPFPDNSFDVVYCSHVLEHVLDDRLAMSELFRVLRSGGWAVLQVPIGDVEKTDEDARVVDPEERRRRFGQEDHLRLYGRDYVNRLREAGFLVTVDDYVKALPEALVEEQRISRSEQVYFCAKPVA